MANWCQPTYHGLISHLHIYFGAMSIQTVAHFIIGLFVLFTIELWKFFMYKYKSFIKYDLQMFYPLVDYFLELLQYHRKIM